MRSILLLIMALSILVCGCVSSVPPGRALELQSGEGTADGRGEVALMLPPDGGRTEVNGPPVVLIHGLGLPRVTMVVLAARLRRSGRTVHILGFNTRLNDLPGAAALLAEQVRELNVTEFDAVTHSAGGVALRWMMSHEEVPKLRRAVLIAAPNNGAQLAEMAHRRAGFLYPLVMGDFGLQLRSSPEGIVSEAGVLEGSEVGIIAGGSGTSRGMRNVFGITGDNDGIVAVEETTLPGMKDFILLRHDHTGVMYARDTARMVNQFLERGEFGPRTEAGHSFVSNR